jgi:hypothetical protein
MVAMSGTVQSMIWFLYCLMYQHTFPLLINWFHGIVASGNSALMRDIINFMACEHAIDTLCNSGSGFGRSCSFLIHLGGYCAVPSNHQRSWRTSRADNAMRNTFKGLIRPLIQTRAPTIQLAGCVSSTGEAALSRTTKTIERAVPSSRIHFAPPHSPEICRSAS